jgi:uncharacterized membrane protein (UPF0127 family)
MRSISRPLLLEPDGREIAQCRMALSLWERFRGLMLARPLAPGEALWLPSCAAVHTAFVRQPIDLVFLRQHRIVRVVDRVAPWRVARCAGADSVIELAAGEIARLRLTAGQAVMSDSRPVHMRVPA